MTRFYVLLGFLIAFAINANAIDLTHDVVLNTSSHKSSSLYLIRNKSHQRLWLTHPHKHVGASAGWASLIAPGNWSAIWVSRKNFLLQCRLDQSGQKIVPCNEYIVLEFKKVIKTPKIAKNQSVWVAENLNKKTLLSRIKARGFVLRHDGF